MISVSTLILSDMDVGQADVSQVFALASIWILFLAFGSASCLMPIIYTVGLAYQDAFSPGLSYVNQAAALSMLNGVLFMTFGSVIGYPIAAASGELICIRYNEVFVKFRNLKISSPWGK